MISLPTETKVVFLKFGSGLKLTYKLIPSRNSCHKKKGSFLKLTLNLHFYLNWAPAGPYEQE